MPSSITVDSTSFNFISLRGEPEPVGLEVFDVSRPGENGHAYWEDAKRGRTFQMEGVVDQPSFTDAATAFDSMLSKQGKLATVVDDRGRIFLNVMLLAVERIGIRPVSGGVGGLLPDGTAAALLLVRFVMQSTR